MAAASSNFKIHLHPENILHPILRGGVGGGGRKRLPLPQPHTAPGGPPLLAPRSRRANRAAILYGQVCGPLGGWRGPRHPHRWCQVGRVRCQHRPPTAKYSHEAWPRPSGSGRRGAGCARLVSEQLRECGSPARVTHHGVGMATCRHASAVSVGKHAMLPVHRAACVSLAGGWRGCLWCVTPFCTAVHAQGSRCAAQGGHGGLGRAVLQAACGGTGVHVSPRVSTPTTQHSRSRTAPSSSL